MIVKIIYNSLLIISLGMFQISFISGLNGPAGQLNLILVVLIFILGFASLDYALWWSVGAAGLMEVFSFLPFGAYLAGLSLTIVIANWLLNYFFTNRSLYTFLALTVLAGLSYKLIVDSLVWLFVKTSGYAPLFGDFWLSLLEQTGMNLAATFVIFYVIHSLGKNFEPVFLRKF